jgi:gliding motility-associated lipoprotein GldD
MHPTNHTFTAYTFLLKPLSILAFILLLVACNSTFTPKPRGYFQIPFPKKKYQVFNQQGYPYTFEYPVYATVVKDSTFFGESTENPWWINIEFPQFNGRIYVSYNAIGGKTVFKIKRNGVYADSVGVNSFDKLIEGSYKLTYEHSSKANSIEDSLFTTRNNINGVFFKVSGNAATAHQFLVTDTTKHFLRGALYFDATPNADSLSIVNNFLLTDMQHLVNTFKWKK